MVWNGEHRVFIAQRYVSMLEIFIEPGLNGLVDKQALGDIWFEQDWATANTVQISMAKLRQMFIACLVSLKGDLGWPARSPDHSIFPVGLPQRKGL